MNEYECCNCFAIGPLTIHGKCARCGSNSVIQQQAIMIANYGMAVTKPQYTGRFIESLFDAVERVK